MTMSNCSILRIGPIEAENNNAAKLQSAILSHFGGGESSSSSNKLSVSNRYFDATISLLTLNEATNANSDQEEDGILLIFDASLSTSFDSLGKYHTSATQNNQAGDLLRLCIGTSHGPSPLSDGSKSSEAEYSRRVLWCLDGGYEYVEVDVSTEGLARGHDERDKEGFARVVEAIGSCMWSSRVMRKAGGGGKEEKHDAAAGEPQKEEEDKVSPSSTISNDKERENAAMATLMNGVKEQQQQQPETNDLPEEDEEDEEAEALQHEMAFHQLESVLSEAKLIREASKNNAMSDEELRERAGETAMKIMGLLDGMGFDDDSDDGGGSSSEEG